MSQALGYSLTPITIGGAVSQKTARLSRTAQPLAPVVGTTFVRRNSDDENLDGLDDVHDVVRELANAKFSNVLRNWRTAFRKFKNPPNSKLNLVYKVVAETRGLRIEVSGCFVK